MSRPTCPSVSDTGARCQQEGGHTGWHKNVYGDQEIVTEWTAD